MRMNRNAVWSLGVLAATGLMAVLAGSACSTSSAKATAVPATQTPNGSQATWTPLAVDTITNTVSPTPTRTITRTRTSTSTNTNTATPCSANPSPIVTGTPITITVDCWNGGGCTVCGYASYLCITNIASPCTFTDPVPGGLAAVQVWASVNGLSCIANGTVQSTVDGTVIGSDCGTTYLCSCNSCQTWDHTSQYYSGGFPSWVYGGTNTYTMTVTGQFCMSHVLLTVGCE